MRIWLFLLASLAVHFTFMKGAPHLPHLPGGDFESESVEIAVVESPNKTSQPERPNRQFIHGKLPKLSDLKPKNAKYLAEENQVVEKEMKARRSGVSRNVIEEAKKIGRIDGADKPEKPEEEGIRKANPYERGGSLSATSDYLPDVAEGPMTLLNAERVIYGTFFNRIQEQVVPRWQQQLESAALGMSPDEMRKVLDKTLITMLDVVVHPNGIIEEVVILSPSGNNRIDYAAKQAFLLSRQFPNPPKGLIKPDGKLHLLYRLRIEPERFAALGR